MLTLVCDIVNFFLGAAFSSMVEGKNEEMLTTELFGGARMHYIFQSIFVNSLEVSVTTSQAGTTVLLYIESDTSR